MAQSRCAVNCSMQSLPSEEICCISIRNVIIVKRHLKGINRLYIATMKAGVFASDKVNPGCFVHLREYPTKSWTSKCKPISFKNNHHLFEQRCILITELCYLLIRLNLGNSVLYISKTLFLTQQNRLFLLYSWEEKYKDRFKGVEGGRLCSNLI